MKNDFFRHLIKSTSWWMPNPAAFLKAADGLVFRRKIENCVDDIVKTFENLCFDENCTEHVILLSAVACLFSMYKHLNHVALKSCDAYAIPQDDNTKTCYRIVLVFVDFVYEYKVAYLASDGIVYPISCQSS